MRAGSFTHIRSYPGVPLIHIPSNFQAGTMSSPFSINPLMTTWNIPAVPGLPNFSRGYHSTCSQPGDSSEKVYEEYIQKVWRIDLTFLMEFEYICIIRYFIHPFVSFLFFLSFLFFFFFSFSSFFHLIEQISMRCFLRLTK